ncbi:coadhesin-like [Patiria miniata]|uniref:Uncharacterized protein n=1 Tax=Patiria miniata TaxID=46514 RepID=A0A913ZTK4_PATMI|nr:coadhesin-like [Patiria miniata]
MTRFVATVVACLIVCGKLADTAQDGYCFRYRDPLGSRGKCQQLVERLPGPDGAPVDTREACCLLGAEGWSNKISGKRCAAACEVPGPVEVQAPQVVQQVAEYEEDQNSVEGVWRRWSDWQPCSVTCGAGFEERRRVCRPSPDNPDDNFQCSGDRVEHRDCNAGIICPVHGQWGEWSLWSECSATCGDTMARFRECDSPSPQFEGNPCVGESREVQWCNDKRHCPIHGGWREWLDWSPCSVTCGRDGERRRIRKCTAPRPRYGGRDCVGDQTDIRSCKANALNCPVDGGVSEWGQWRCQGECTGEGFALRSRSCTNPVPRHGGRQCQERLNDIRDCSKVICPVDGMWSTWSPWNDCSSTCGKASFKTRTRQCDNPPPQNEGLKCQGEKFDNENCKLAPCLGDGDSSYSASADSSVEGGTTPPCDDEDYPSPTGEGGSGCRDPTDGSGNDVDNGEISSLEYE